MDSNKRYTWYIDKTLIPLTLFEKFDPDLEPAKNKINITKALLSTCSEHSERKNIPEQLDFRKINRLGLHL